MKKTLFLIFAFLVQIAAMAQDATKILDTAAARFKESGDVRITFRANTQHGTNVGTLDVSSNKFFCDLSGAMVWFDGKTMWHYTKSTQEVNITNPSANEVARMNPYSFISLYKKGYNCKMGKSTASYYEVVLTGGKKTAYKEVVVHLDKAAYKPVYVKTVTAKSTTEININSFLKNQNFRANYFSFNKKEFPKAEIVDLR